jgi:hypothetical protein
MLNFLHDIVGGAYPPGLFAHTERKKERKKERKEKFHSRQAPLGGSKAINFQQMSIIKDHFSLFHMAPWTGLPALIQPSCHRAFVPLRVLRQRSSVETVSRCCLLLFLLPVGILGHLIFRTMRIRPASNADKVSRLGAAVPSGY